MRNRCKRVLREALRGVESKYELRGGYLIVLVARDATAYAKSHEVERDLTRAFSRLGMLSGTRQKSQSNEKLS